mgnify:FL=1
MSVTEILKESTLTSYSQLSKEKLLEFMTDLHKPCTVKRELVMLVDQGGKDMFDNAVKAEIEKQNDRDFADFLLSKTYISEDEKTRIHQMIDATPDDYEVAKAILTSLSEKHFSYYHTTKRLKS